MKSNGWIFFVLFAAFLIYSVNKSMNKRHQVTQDVHEVITLKWPVALNQGEKLDSADQWTTKNYYILMDGSGSMSESKCGGGRTKIEVAKQALANFIRNVPQTANLGLAVFDGAGLSERNPLQQGNREKVLASINSIQPDGYTPLKSGIKLSIEKLNSRAAKQQAYGEYHLVVVTDGEASDGEDPRTIVTAMTGQTPIVLHTIGFCVGTGHSLNQSGRVLYQAADSPEELNDGLKEVLAEATDFDVKSFKTSK